MGIASDLIDIEFPDIVADRLGGAMFGGTDEALDFDVLAEAEVLGGSALLTYGESLEIVRVSRLQNLL